jgi:transposase
VPPAFIRSREDLEHLIVTRHTDGWSIHGLARDLRISRNMVRRILRNNAKQRDEGHDSIAVRARRQQTPRGSKLDAFVDRMREHLDKFPRITGHRMFEKLRDAGYTGGKTIVHDKLRTLRPRPKQEPVIRFETEPGRQGQMDWSPYTIPFGRTGKATVECFSYILGFSRRQFIDMTPNRQFHTLIRRHRDTFEHYRGVPRQCLYDSEKTVVLRWEANRPVFNPAFVAFITHYQCKPVACRRGRPETKGKIERPFQYVENNLLNARQFEDIEHLRATARWWINEVSDKHIHDTTGRPPIELFIEQERESLLPLPLHPYDCAEVCLRVCSLEGFVEFETNTYSVPYEYVADILTLKATENEIIIYSPELDRIAWHERLPDGARRQVENLDHRGNKNLRYGLEPVREAFMALGEGAEAFLRGLELKHSHNPGFHARAILRLKENFHCDDILKALIHAHRYQAFDARQVERILKARAKPRNLESIRKEQARGELQRTLPSVQQRSLDAYDRLLRSSEEPCLQQEGCTDGQPAGTDQDAPEDPESACHGSQHRPDTDRGDETQP